MSEQTTVKWLEEMGVEIAHAGHNGWGNTCTDASVILATVIDQRDALKAELAALKAQRVPMSDEQIDTITREQWGTDHSSWGYLAHRTYARAVLKAHHNIQEVKP